MPQVVPVGNRLKLVSSRRIASLGIVNRWQVYCSKIVHTDYPIKIQHFHMLGTKYRYTHSIDFL